MAEGEVAMPKVWLYKCWNGVLQHDAYINFACALYPSIYFCFNVCKLGANLYYMIVLGKVMGKEVCKVLAR